MLKRGGEREERAWKRKELRLQYAAENRRAEISLLWQRSLYFFGFLSLQLVAFSTAFANSHRTVALVICCYGVVTSTCWSLTNRSSKYWQGVWEKKTEAAERAVLSPRVFSRDTNPVVSSRWFWGARQFSPSKLVIALSDVSAAVWIALGLGTVVSRFPILASSGIFVTLVNVATVLATACVSMIIGLWCRSGPAMKLWQARRHVRTLLSRPRRWGRRVLSRMRE